MRCASLGTALPDDDRAIEAPSALLPGAFLAQRLIAAERIGAWPRVGGVLQRLPTSLFDIAEAIDRLAAAPAATRRDFAAAPRAFLREALGEDADPTVIEQLFQETAAWSDRVVGLGLWTKRVVPWVTLPATDWFGP